MQPTLRLVLAAVTAAALAACSSGKPVRVFPPTASIQQIGVDADGSWQVAVRLQNFSNVGMRVARIDAGLSVAQARTPLPIDASPDFVVPANSAEVLAVRVSPDAAARAAVAAALAGGGSVRYRLAGTIHSTEPHKRHDPFEFESALTPVPGVPDTLR